MPEPPSHHRLEPLEVAPHPTPATRELVSRIFSDGGPVDRAYRRYGISYRVDPALLQDDAQGTLLIDRDAELRCVLPAMRRAPNGRPTLTRLHGFWRTFQNLGALGRLSPARALPHLESELVTNLRAPATLQVSTVGAAVTWFLDRYVTVVAVNVVAASAVDRCARALGSARAFLTTLLAAPPGDLTLYDDGIAVPQGVIGNTLELADASPLVASRAVRRTDPRVEAWWSRTPPSRRHAIAPILRDAARGQRLRECGRWLAVQSLAPLRAQLRDAASARSLDPDLAWFAPLTTWDTEGPIDLASLLAARATWRSQAARAHPTVGGAGAGTVRLPCVSLAPGSASGVLVTPEDIAAAPAPRVLLAPALSADLVRHFGDVEGIIAGRGGVLAHAAIVARERGLPAVVTPAALDGTLTPGDTVRVDGVSGTIDRERPPQPRPRS